MTQTILKGTLLDEQVELSLNDLCCACSRPAEWIIELVEEGVLEDIREGDVGAILGWGFAPWSGGPFSWLDIIGTPYAAERCDQLAAAYGPRLACPAPLPEMADQGPTFYGRFGVDKKAA